MTRVLSEHEIPNDRKSEVPFWIEVLLSVAAHVLLIALIFLRVLLLPPMDDLDVQNAIRVDLVGLPDKVKLQPATPLVPQEPEPKPNVAPPPENTTTKIQPEIVLEHPAKVDAKKLKQSQAEALRRLEALTKIDKDLKTEAAKKQRELEKATFKGNQLRPGDSLTGADKLQKDEYFKKLDTHLKNHWFLTPLLAQLNLRARAIVFLDNSGNVISRRIKVSSNNPEFDSRVLDAIDQASPFPAPPERFVQLFELKGVEFAFPD